MTDKQSPYGYFNWYRTNRNTVTYKKMLAVLRDVAVSNSNKHEAERYRHNLIAEHPLTERQWNLELEDLKLVFPAPTISVK